MSDPNKLEPEESYLLDNIHQDIIYQQERKRKRTFRIILALGILAVVVGAVIGWNA